MIKNETILASIYMIKDYKNGVHFLEETVDRVLNELKLLDAELEALQSRSCEGCRHFRDDNHAPSFDGYCVNVGTYIEGENELLPLDVDRNFCCNKYEAKEQL